MTEEQKRQANHRLNSPESIAKRKKTMAERYSKADRSAWGKKGGESGNHDNKGFGHKDVGEDGLTGPQRAVYAGRVRKGGEYEIASSCCSGKLNQPLGICNDCGEHASPVELDED